MDNFPKYIFILIILIITTTVAEGNVKSITIPGVSSRGEGVVSTVELRIVPGDGRVFSTVKPISGAYTQQSLETAVDVACHLAGVNRKRYDFLFTFISDSYIIDGPSAGAALTLLTYATLTDKDMVSAHQARNY